MRVIPITDFYSREQVQFAYNHRLKYTDEVYWIEEDGLCAVAIPAAEWKDIEFPKSRYLPPMEYDMVKKKWFKGLKFGGNNGSK